MWLVITSARIGAFRYRSGISSNSKPTKHRVHQRPVRIRIDTDAGVVDHLLVCTAAVSTASRSRTRAATARRASSSGRHPRRRRRPERRHPVPHEGGCHRRGHGRRSLSCVLEPGSTRWASPGSMGSRQSTAASLCLSMVASHARTGSFRICHHPFSSAACTVQTQPALVNMALAWRRPSSTLPIYAYTSRSLAPRSTQMAAVTVTEALLLHSQGVAGATAVLPASRPRHGSRLLRLRTRAQQCNLRQMASIDDLRQVAARDDNAVNGHTPAVTPTPECARAGGGIGTAAQRLRAIAEAAADRDEMHDIIGRQRDNWNHLLLHSTNSLTLTAYVMSALAPAAPATVGALRASARVLLATAAVTMAAVNRIQPSQLAEEQRNATRLWRQLQRDVHAAVLELDNHGTPTETTEEAAVQQAMDRVLALDAAYPLPLFPGMLELDKFPSTVEPARWWPTRQPPTRNKKNPAQSAAATAANGWTRELEDEMCGIARVLRAKDELEHVWNAKLALRLNRGLAVAGPALAGTAALATAFIGSTSGGEAAAVCGALAAAANTVEHGWQVGMVFDMFHNVAGFYGKVQEDIEACLDEVDAERRENGEVFRTKVALLLGRSTDDLT